MPGNRVCLDCLALDEMGGRIDELEQSINNLKAEMGVENEAPADKTGEKEPANTKDQ